MRYRVISLWCCVRPASDPLRPHPMHVVVLAVAYGDLIIEPILAVDPDAVHVGAIHFGGEYTGRYRVYFPVGALERLRAAGVNPAAVMEDVSDVVLIGSPDDCEWTEDGGCVVKTEDWWWMHDADSDLF
ncbi:MAG: hypothetical protein IMW98_09630 [Firmicutes bacterium]|nr:hypothetical protein [Bacillota bacterium]